MTEPDADGEREFTRLVEEMARATALDSNPYAGRRHPDYPRLLGYGKAAVPWVLRRIAAGHYGLLSSLLLCDLTGERPGYEPDSVAGGHMAGWDVRAFADAWLEWGKGHRYTS